MKKIGFFRLLTLCLSMTVSLAWAGNEGGGGDQLILEFIQTANNLLREPSIDQADKAILKKALNSTKIVTVFDLKNPITGNSIPNQKTILAWGSPNLIQLKLSNGQSGEVAWDRLNRKTQSIAHLVFHELYRASGVLNERGESPDDAFQLSVTKYKLDQLYIGHQSESCEDAKRLLLEAYVYKALAGRFGKHAKISMVSDMSMTNFYSSNVLECIYKVYSVIEFLDSNGKRKMLVGDDAFSSNFERPYLNNPREVTPFP